MEDGAFSDKMVDKYEKYKTKNISLKGSITDKNYNKRLISIENLTMGYGYKLFKSINFELFQGERIRIHGRNGAGKTTFLRYLISMVDHSTYNIDSVDNPCVFNETQIFSGKIKINKCIKLGLYEQEISSRYLSFKLTDAIFEVHKDMGKILSPQEILNLMGRYLFDINVHKDSLLSELSGGEKARFQMIKMLASDPNLLILDEPTNHLDLPSIDELETFLMGFSGAVIYVSHDSYFVKKLKSEELEILKTSGA